MQFLFPALAAGFLFVAVPPLVHLINMLRHRRQQWAAMEFLLASYRKQKKWIILRQLLLLLCRVAVAAVMIAMLAGWSGGSGWLDALGGKTTHHVVILDDSFSMSDTSGGASAYERALAALNGLSRRLAAAEGSHQLTVIRSSRAGLVVRGGSEAADSAADLSAAELGADLRAIDRVTATRPSPLDDDCSAALKLAVDLARATPSGRTVVYLMSDFRERNWQAAEASAESIGALSRLGAEMRMIDCTVPPATNLSVVSLEPLPDVWVAGVPVVLRATVRNHGSTPVRNVSLASRVVRYGTASLGPNPAERLSGRSDSLPGILFEQIPPGGEITKQFQVFLAESGTHVIEVELPEDCVTVDNRRACTLPLSDAAKVLIIDGDVEGRGAYHVASVLDPGGQVRTGAVPDIRQPGYLRTVTPSELSAYRAIYLIDLPEVDSSSAAVLDSYVTDGGGLMWFIGSRVIASRYNETVYSDRIKLLPGPLSEPLKLDSSGASAAPDLTLGPVHPLTEPFAVIGDAALSLVRVEQTAGMQIPEIPSVPVSRIFNRRDGEPFVLQHDVGRGRVVTVLSGLSDGWTNWTGDPTFVVYLLRANAFMWSSATASTVRRVDEPLIVDVSLDNYSRTGTYFAAVDEPPRIPIEYQADEASESMVRFELNATAAAIDGKSDLDAMLHPGVSELWLTRLDGEPEVRLSASAVVAGEGDLTLADRAAIRTALQPVAVTFFDASDVIASEETNGGSLMSIALFCLLGLLLCSEQILAYFASYHPPLLGAKS